MNKYAKRLIKYGVKNYKRYMIIVLILGIITIIFGSLRPFFLQYLIDEIISLQKINILPYFLIFLIGVVALERSFNYFFNTYHRKVNFLTIKNEQIKLYNKIQNSKFVEYSKIDSGDIMSRLLSDIDVVNLNKAPINLQHRVIYTGDLLYCRDKIKLADFKEKVFKLYGDYGITLKFFYEDYLKGTK